MTGAGQDTIVPHTLMDIAVLASATHGVGAASTADIPHIMDIMDIDTADTDMVTGTVTETDTMMAYTLATITTTTTATDPSLTDTSTAMVSTTARPMTATTTEEIVPTWQVAAAEWVAAITPTVPMPTTMAAESTQVPTAEGLIPTLLSAKDMML